MAASVIDGKAVAARVRAEVAEGVAEFAAQHGRPPGLATILIGEDPGSAIYVASKQKVSAEVGIRGFDHRLAADVSRDEVVELIERLNADPEVSGILCQLPVPDHLDGVELTGLIDPRKDVDGLHPLNVGLMVRGEPSFPPATPYGIVELLLRSGVELEGAEIVVAGYGDLVGAPLSILLAQDWIRGNATVTVCHVKTRDLAEHTRRADILVAATGRPQLVTADMIKPGAVVVDVGVHRTEHGLVGDVAFDEVKEVAGMITPVPGGVGPMTTAMLLLNTISAAEKLSEQR